MTTQPGPDATHSFADQYVHMSEAELLKLAAAYDSLVEPAQAALRGEFARRGLEPPIVPETEEVSSQPLVTLRRYRDLSEAIVGRAMLESGDIFCFLQDENFLRLDWGAAIALGGLRLQVRPEDVHAAEELLSQPIPEAIPFDGQDKADYVQPHCPRCGSSEVTAARAGLTLATLSAPAEDEAWRCETCGCLWTDD
jgi:hypothetical protein